MYQIIYPIKPITNFLPWDGFEGFKLFIGGLLDQNITIKLKQILHVEIFYFFFKVYIDSDKFECGYFSISAS